MASCARPAASKEEVLEGISVRHEAYGRKMPLASYQAARLASRREHRATPWVLDRGDGTIVATLLCYELDLALDAGVYRAYGLGSVGTRVAHRRQGHAAALCRAACEASEAAGRSVGLLFSGIAPTYYERLGFRVSSASACRCERLPELCDSGPAATLAPFDPRRDLARITGDYVAFHRGTLHMHRDRRRFLESIEDGVDDWFFRIEGADRGYLRLAKYADGTLGVVEPIVLDPALEAPAIRAAARLALAHGLKGVSGWYDPPLAVSAWFTPQPRDEDRPMLRGAPPHASARFWGSDHF